MTANFGELLPITCIETVPGDYIEMRVSDLLRAMPMVTSPFLRAKQHIDVWFTSYDDLWHNFSQFITMKEQPVSAAMQSSKFCPSTTLNTLFAVANSKRVDLSSKSYIIDRDIVGRNYEVGAKKLLDFLGYGKNYLQSLSDNKDVSPRVNLWRIAQYNKIWYDEYRQQYYDDGSRGLSSDYDGNPARLFNFDDLPCDSVSNSDPILTLDGSQNENGLERFRAMLQMRYRLWKKDLYTGVLPNTQFGNVSTLPIIDGLLIQNQVYGTNFDDPDSPTYALTDSDFDSWRSSLLWNDSGYDNANVRMANGEKNLAEVYSGASLTHNHKIDVQNQIGVSSRVLSNGGLDILALRKAEALQIWRENALRAGNRISDNLRAHYGNDAEYNDHRSVLLGSVSAPLNIQDIDATAQTGYNSNEQLADVAGKGLSSTDEKVFKFKAHQFGCIMVIFSMLPEAEYQSDGVDRMNQLLEMEDYFISEYQNTGLESVSNMTFLREATGSHGFAPAYVGYKQKLDKCFEGFKMNQPFSAWASPKTDIGTLSISSLGTMYVNPALYNRNFGIAVTGTPGAEATTEQFLCDFYFDVNAVRAMSVVGLPQNS